VRGEALHPLRLHSERGERRKRRGRKEDGGEGGSHINSDRGVIFLTLKKKGGSGKGKGRPRDRFGFAEQGREKRKEGEKGEEVGQEQKAGRTWL